MDNDTYDGLVADFYRSATGATPWAHALENLRIAFDALVAEIETVDLPSRTLLSLQTSGPDMERAAFEYVREFQSICPRAKAHFERPLGTWLHSHEIFDEEFVARDRFYSEYVPAYDAKFGSGMMFELDENTVATIALVRGHRRGPLDREERFWLQRLGEHLREAIIGYERVRKMAFEALAGHKLLMTFPYPMWLLDADRYLYFANPAAEREMRQEVRLGRHGRRLHARFTAVERALTQQISALMKSGHLASTTVDLRQNESDPPTWLHLSLIVPGRALGAFGERPQVLATLFDPRQVSSLDAFALSNLFRLTPTEAKVAAQIAEGMEPDKIAEANGTRVCTVRSQLSKVLAKLGVMRQAEVVRILRQGEALWSKVPGAH
jgi:DNA-binding CsgD family transcriptional regulator